MPRYAILHLHLTDSQRLVGPNDPETFDPYFDASMGKPDAAVAKGLYRPACVINAEDAEDLYMKTQNIDASWTLKTPPLAGDKELRSTSVGDFIVEQESGDVFFCASIGWDKATGETETRMREMATELFAVCNA